MANKMLNTRIQLRHDTAENWETNKTTVPLAGEVCVETDTNKMKIGDGTKTYEELKYFGGEASKHYEVTATNDQTDLEAIAAAVGSDELTEGATAVVKRTITTGKLSYTAYVYHSGAWTAMDGNYSADNVYFDSDLTYTAAIGVKTVPASGSGKISAAGKNVKEVLASILAEEKNPTTTQPSAAFSATGGLGTSYEVGTKTDLTYTAKLNAGSYSYGPSTNVTAQTYSVTCNGESKTTATGTFEDVVAEETEKKISLTITYGDGAVPITNLGNAYAAGQIKAGSKSTTSSAYKGVRFMYWGPVTSDVALNSANIRALSKKKATSTGALGNFTAGANAVKIIVAVPSNRTIKSVLLASSMNADITSQFVKQGSTVNVEGANGYTAAAYNVYVYKPAQIGAGETYNITIG